MNVWQENFIWIALLMAALGWFVPSWLWIRRLQFVLRLCFSLAISIAVLSFTGGVLAVVVHAAELGVSRIVNLFLSDVGGGLRYFVEVGLETAIFWVPILLLRVGWMSVLSWRNRDS